MRAELRGYGKRHYEPEGLDTLVDSHDQSSIGLTQVRCPEGEIGFAHDSVQEARTRSHSVRTQVGRLHSLTDDHL